VYETKLRHGAKLKRLDVILLISILVYVLFARVAFNTSVGMSSSIPMMSQQPVILGTPLALTESLGFMDDISDTEWKEMKAIAREMKDNSGPQENVLPRFWYQNNWEPTIACRFLRRIGGLGDGPKWICDPHRITKAVKQRRGVDNKKADCLVYSVGSNGDFTFENGLQQFLENGSICEVHTFDFGDFHLKAENYAHLNIHYHQWGLKGSYNDTTFVYNQADLLTKNPFKTLQETMQVLGHSGRSIDIFKIDCEGCEWSTYKDWLTADIRQILVELHGVPANKNQFFTDLKKAGYAVFSKEPNTIGCTGECIEYSFLKLDPKFVSE
jgi:Methyltransferase domain